MSATQIPFTAKSAALSNSTPKSRISTNCGVAGNCMSCPQTKRLVIALHGSASSGRQWQSLADRLGNKATVLAPDLPGYGTASHDLSRTAYFNLLMRQTQGAVDLVAHSFGSTVALWLANTFPHRVQSVTLYDPVAPSVGESGSGCVPRDLWRLWCAVENRAPHRAMSQFMAYWMGPGAWASLSEKRKAALAAQHRVVLQDFREILGGVWTVPAPVFAGPVNVLCGTQSPIAVEKICNRLCHDYPQARCAKLPDLGHMAPLTHADEIDRVLALCLNNTFVFSLTQSAA